MNIPELLIGAVIGVVVGAMLRRPIVRLERSARAVWREPPLLVHVERDPAIIWAGAPDWVPFSVYFRDVSTLPDPPPDRDNWLTWARKHGGIDGSVTQLSVTLQAKNDVAVVIENLRVRNEVHDVTDGAVLIRRTGGADLVPRHFHIDLDWGSNAVVTYRGEGGEPAGKIPRMKIPAGDIEQFQIWAEASKGWHSWTVELLLLVEGRRVIVSIDDDGGPFATVGSNGLPVRMNAAGTTTWEPWPDH